jgi:hypothetical protein
LLPPAGFAIPPSELGFDASVADLRASLEFWARDDGTPVVIGKSVSWTDAQGAYRTEGEFVITEFGTPVTISAPAEVWGLFTSSRFEYQIAYPPSWQVTSEGTEVRLLGPAGIEGKQVVITRSQETNWTLAEWVSGRIAATLPDFKKRPDSSRATEIGGEPARILTYHYTDPGGNKGLLLDAEVVHGERGYTIAWLSPAGSEAMDRDEFGSILSTFAFSS